MVEWCGEETVIPTRVRLFVRVYFELLEPNLDFIIFNMRCIILLYSFGVYR